MDATEAFGALTAALDYPMYVVTLTGAGRRAGCLVGFGTQCSIDPPRLLVCLSRQNHTCRVAKDAERLAVHLLGADQRPLAELFGTETGDDLDKFERCAWTPAPDGTPLLDDCPNRIVGPVSDRVELGDHVGHVVDLEEASVAGDRPGRLLTFQAVRDLEPGHPA
ncbi:MAG TPA: flavin reductase family protein [Acidimicrobiales bacterium]|jgi:flavin reductase (DIM6/NTAB) family NADH-FMN oxidoreductase RutF|nr:flavin reductase family protein [Acidimicrobiales bacterium]